MIEVDSNFVSNMSNAVILSDSNGSILKMNKPALFLLSKLRYDYSLKKITEIDPNFNSNISSNNYQKYILLNNLRIKVDIYNVKYNNILNTYMYIFENIIIQEEFDKLFDLIDDVIVIVNKDGVVEKINNAAFKLIGIDWEPTTGKFMKEFTATQQIISDPISLKILQFKKPLSMKVKYNNGKTLFFTGRPVLDEKGDVIKAIAIGRDITKLIHLEEKLRIAEKKKNEYILKLEDLREYFGTNQIVCSSKSMEYVIRTALKVAQTDSSVFLWGESGAGKEVIARLIHNSSKRKEKPFIAINCAAIPTELLESELFGYENGSFTGANKDGKIGLLETANGGTVFLDELGELPYNMQSKLLRVIQENKFMRIGSHKLITIDVRYISATNLPRIQLLNQKKFRQDLYYRLSVVPIELPPLRDRKEDILPLIHHYLKHFNSKYKRNIRLSPRLLERLYEYKWPGNIRELRNVIERFVVLADKDIIDDEMFNIVNQFGNSTSYEDNEEEIKIKNLMPLKKAYNIVENLMIKRAFNEYGTIVKTAKILEIDPSTIHRKIKRGDIKL